MIVDWRFYLNHQIDQRPIFDLSKSDIYVNLGLMDGGRSDPLPLSSPRGFRKGVLGSVTDPHFKN